MEQPYSNYREIYLHKHDTFFDLSNRQIYIFLKNMQFVLF